MKKPAAELTFPTSSEQLAVGLTEDKGMILYVTVMPATFAAMRRQAEEATGPDVIFIQSPEARADITAENIEGQSTQTLRFLPAQPRIPVRVRLWAHKDGFLFTLGDAPWSMPFTAAGIEAAAWPSIAAALNTRNERAGLQHPTLQTPRIESGARLSNSVEAPTITRASRKGDLRSQPLPGAILFPSNNVHGASVRALTLAARWLPNLDGFAFGTKEELANLTITVGLPNSPQSETLWQFLSKGGAATVKAHYALWARWYEEAAQPGEYLTIHLNQFCSDIGYERHHNGGFKRERKQQAARILEALTSVEMRATFTTPGSKKALRMRGPLWQRGLLAEQNDQYADLFGAARDGDPDLWEPLALSYQPGDWFRNPEWHRYNMAIGKIGAGLLKLRNDSDEWAILIGGYLGTLMRANQYRPLRLRVGRILQRTGLAQSKDAKRRVEETREKLWHALDKLCEVGVIAEWTWSGVDTTEPDMDDAEALVEYGQQEAFPPGDLCRRLVEITLPAEREPDRARLETAQAKAITTQKRAAARRRKNERKPE